MSFECFSFGLDVYDEIKLLIDQQSTVSIQLEGNKGTGFGWYLENKEELLKANIKPLNLNEHLSVEFIKAKEEDKSLGLKDILIFILNYYQELKILNLNLFIKDLMLQKMKGK